MYKIAIPLMIGILSFLNPLYAQNYNEVLKIVSYEREAGDRFGIPIEISGNYAAVGGYQEDHDVNGNNPLSQAGSVYIYEKNVSGDWIFKQKLTASDRGADDYFSCDLSISGNYLIVGAYYEDHDENGTNTLSKSGSAYIFERNASGVWVEVQKIVASDRRAGAEFGNRVSISGDIALVGAWIDGYDENGNNYISSSGSAYIFERNASGIWVETQKLSASIRHSADYFGSDVGISGDYAVIGAFGHDLDLNETANVSNAGAAYLFERDLSGTWNFVQKVVSTNRNVSDLYGQAVSISGGYAVVGAYRDDYDANGSNYVADAGAIFIYERNAGGTWTKAAKLTGSSRYGNDRLGTSVCVNGNDLIVGAQLHDYDLNESNYLSSAGAAYIFKRDGAGNWNFRQKLVASTRYNTDCFGSYVCISGNTAFVNAFFHDYDASGANYLSEAGALYLFETPSPNTLVWTGTSNTDWDEPLNWDLGSVPHTLSGVTIPSVPAGGNFPEGISGNAAECLNLTIQPGALLKVPGGSTLDISGDLQVNNGGYICRYGTVNISGSVQINSILPLGGYHYISSPFTNLPISEYADDINLITGNPYIGNDTTNTVVPFPSFFEYDETYPQPSMSLGWDDPGPNLLPMKGYAINSGAFSASVPYDLNLGGAFLNTGNISIPITNTPSGVAAYDGWNLVGNPYLSPIDWDAPSGWTKTNVNNAIYFFTPTSQYGGVYSTYINGIGIPSGTDGIIPPLQGFFIKASANGTLGVTNDVQVTDAFTFYKEARNIPLIRLSLKSANSTTRDETVICLEPKATGIFEGDWDAQKILPTDTDQPSIYTCSEDEIALAVNAQSVPSYGDIHIPLKIKSKKTETIKLSCSQLDNIPAEVSVYFHDRKLSKCIHIDQQLEYQCINNPVDDPDRFYISISLSSTFLTENGSVDVFSNEGSLFVSCSLENFTSGSISLYDLSGRQVCVLGNMQQGMKEYDISQLSEGIYILSVKTDRGNRTFKIFR